MYRTDGDSRSRARCDSRVSHATLIGAPGELAKSMSPETSRSWFCRGAGLKSAQFLSPSRALLVCVK